MHFQEFDKPDDFRTEIVPVLMHHEKENNLLLSVFANIEEGLYENARLFAVHDEQGAPAAAAVMTPPHNLLLSYASDEATAFMAREVKARDIPVPGFHMHENITPEFIKYWVQAGGAEPASEMQMILYTAPSITKPTDIPGRLRQAKMEDLPLLMDMFVAFAIEADLPEHEQGYSPQKQRRLEYKIRKGHIYLWQVEDEPVSVAGFSHITPNGVRLGPVYTPTALRGKGYASACVAGLSSMLLDKGIWCALFADTQNPQSNKIYQRIGYEPYCRFYEYRL